MKAEPDEEGSQLFVGLSLFRGEETIMQEVKPLREVPGVPQHCGKPMTRMSSGQPDPATGDPIFVYVCDCGAQTRPPKVK